jgi:multiubiquitin
MNKDLGQTETGHPANEPGHLIQSTFVKQLLEEIEEVLEELVDLEEYAESDRKPPRAKRYRIRIDGEKYVVSVPSMTGRELLELAGKRPPDKFMIVEKVRGQKPRRIGLDECVDFTKHGVEKFLTQPLGQTEG